MTERSKFVLTILTVILISLPVRLYHLNYPILDSHSFRQTQTATVALNFYKNGINLFKTELDVFGIGPKKYLLLEFPLYQAAVAFLYKSYYFNEVWGRLVSILSGYIGAFFLYKIAFLIIKNKKTALISVLFYLFVPLNMFFHRSFMIDPMVVTFLLAATYFFLMFTQSQNIKYWFLTVILFSLGFIQKALYGPFWLIPLIFIRIKKHSLKSLFRIDFIFLILIPLLILFSWQVFENIQNTLHNQTYFTSTNRDQWNWNSGNLQDRLNWQIWKLYLTQIVNSIMLKPGILLFFIGLFAAKTADKTGFLYFLLISQIVYTLTFFRIQSHYYYQLPIVPVISIFMALGLVKLVKIFRNRQIKSILVSLFFVIYIGKSWNNTLPSFYIDWSWYRTFSHISTVLAGASPVIFATPGYDWNSIYSYYLRKKLLIVSVEDINEEKLVGWQREGYSYLMLYDLNNIKTRLSQLGKPDLLKSFANFPVIYDEHNILIYKI